MDSNPNNKLADLQNRINQYDMRFPVATIVKATGLNKGYVSAVINGKKPISDNFWDTFNEKFPEKPSANGQQKPTDILIGAHVTLQDYIDDLRRDKATLYALANSILDQIKLDTKTALAYQMAWVDYEAERAAKGDEHLKLELIHKMNTLVRSYLPGHALENNETESGKRHKE